MPKNSLQELLDKAKRYIAKDVISEEINIRLAAMAAVFPEFAIQLKAVADDAEAKRLLALQAQDAARKALADALAAQMIADKQANDVALLMGK